MDLIDNPWMRECAVALVLFLQAGAAFALAAHAPTGAPATAGDDAGMRADAHDGVAPQPAPGAAGGDDAGILPHRCEVFAVRTQRPVAASSRSFEHACRKLDRLPITETDAETLYQQMLVQAGGDAAG